MSIVKAFLRPKIRSCRIQMIFPLQGSERSRMVSVEAKKKQVRAAVGVCVLVQRGISTAQDLQLAHSNDLPLQGSERSRMVSVEAKKEQVCALQPSCMCGKVP